MITVVPTQGHKPAKPYSSFPVTTHNNGQWCKKIRAKIHKLHWTSISAWPQTFMRVANHHR